MQEHSENFPRPPPELIEGEKEWKVEQILGMRKFGRNKQTQYRVLRTVSQWTDRTDSYSGFVRLWYYMSE